MKKVLSVILATVMIVGTVMSAFPSMVFASTSGTEGYYTYEIVDGEVCITGLDEGFVGELIIPATIEGCPVTEIGKHAFFWCENLTGIVIPASVTTIVDYAIGYCPNLTSILVEEGNQNYKSDGNCLIEKNSNTVIQGCKNSIIPYGVTTIGNRAFKSCYGLTNIVIPNSVTTIEELAFDGCSNLTSVVISDSVKSIGVQAFYECSSLTSVTMGSGVTTIDFLAFDSCVRLSNVYYCGTEKDRKKISIESFNDCLLDATWHYMGETDEDCTHSYDNDCDSDCNICGGTRDAEHELYWEITKEPTATQEGERTKDCWKEDCNYQAVTESIAKTVSSVEGDGVKLEIIDSGEENYRYSGTLEVELLGTNGFIEELRQSLKDMGYSEEEISAEIAAFEEEVKTLTDAVKNNGFNTVVESFIVRHDEKGDYYFGLDPFVSDAVERYTLDVAEELKEATGLKLYTISGNNEIVEIETVIADGKITFTSEELINADASGDMVFLLAGTVRGNESGSDCTHAYDSSADMDCNLCGAIKSVLSYEIVDGEVTITDLGQNFEGALIIPEIIGGCPVTSIGRTAFQYCNLASVEIPESVISVGDYAFQFCYNLEYIFIPAKVTSIGELAFNGCSGLTSIIVDKENEYYYSEGNCLIGKEWGNLVSGCNNSVIPEGVTSIGDGAFYGCKGVTNLVIPEGVTSIGNGAFAGCNGLTRVEIPDSIMNIGWNAFSGCPSLTDVYYNGTEEDRTNIMIGEGNDDLSYATWHYAESDAKLGDLDGNGTTNIIDVQNLFVKVANGQTGEIAAAIGDFDGNGTVNIIDVQKLFVAVANGQIS